jgi:hypothetical protein
MLFISDVALVITKKVRKRIVLSYIGAAALFAPWFIFFLKNKSADPWNLNVPAITELFNIGKRLLNHNLIIIFLCILAFVAITIIFLTERKQTIVLPAFICASTASGFILIMYLTSIILTKYFKIGNFWTFRYFLVILPFLIFVPSSFFVLVIERLKIEKTYIPAIIICAVLAFYLPQSYIELKSTPSPTQSNDWLEAAADWLCQQPDIHDPNVGVYARVRFAWKEYTAEQLGRRDALPYVAINDSLNSIDKLYTLESHVPMSWELKTLNEQFEIIGKDDKLHIKIWKRKVMME